MVPAEGIEPPTFGLQNRCTTAVLSRPADALAGQPAHRAVHLFPQSPRLVNRGGVNQGLAAWVKAFMKPSSKPMLKWMRKLPATETTIAAAMMPAI